MDELKPTLEDWVERHDDMCTCEMLFDWTPALCDCGQAERVKELAQLRLDASGHYIKGGDGSHWEGCEETHYDCKIAKLERELSAAQDESLAFKVIADLRADLAAARKRLAESEKK